MSFSLRAMLTDRTWPVGRPGTSTRFPVRVSQILIAVLPSSLIVLTRYQPLCESRVSRMSQSARSTSLCRPVASSNFLTLVNSAPSLVR